MCSASLPTLHAVHRIAVVATLLRCFLAGGAADDEDEEGACFPQYMPSTFSSSSAIADEDEEEDEDDDDEDDDEDEDEDEDDEDEVAAPKSPPT